MKFEMIDVVLLLGAYLIGSIATSVWIGKIFYGIDIREKGSGNAGATNTFRVLGVKAGIPVFIIDTIKGILAVKLALLNTDFIQGSNSMITFQIFLGIVAVLGHVFPVYVGFKGGKGVATLFGVVIALTPNVALYAALIFIVMLLVFKYVSLSSMVAGLSFPILLLTVFKIQSPSLIIFSVTIAVLLLVTHTKNIERLLKREEAKADILKKFRRNKNIE